MLFVILKGLQDIKYVFRDLRPCSLVEIEVLTAFSIRLMIRTYETSGNSRLQSTMSKKTAILKYTFVAEMS